MNMRHFGYMALMIVVTVQASGCMMDERDYRNEVQPGIRIDPHAKHYSPGFTGYSSGYGGYGGYLNGFGPYYWNPRYYYYSGYGNGYGAGV